MNIRLEITISSDELEIIKLIIKAIKTKVYKVIIFPGGFAITSWDGTWPADLESIVSSVRDNLNVDMVDGIKSPSFKKVIVSGFPKLFD